MKKYNYNNHKKKYITQGNDNTPQEKSTVNLIPRVLEKIESPDALSVYIYLQFLIEKNIVHTSYIDSLRHKYGFTMNKSVKIICKLFEIQNAIIYEMYDDLGHLALKTKIDSS